MSIFHYFQELKCTVWERKFFDVEADTEAEANEIACRCVRDHISMCAEEHIFHLEEDETLYDTMDLIPVEENHGSATIEIYKRERTSKGSYKLIADNQPKKE